MVDEGTDSVVIGVILMQINGLKLNKGMNLKKQINELKNDILCEEEITHLLTCMAQSQQTQLERHAEITVKTMKGRVLTLVCHANLECLLHVS
jgi:hypothetical protein